MRKENPERSPEEPDRSAEVQIVVTPAHFRWLTTQCEFAGISKQEMIAGVLEEWISRNGGLALPPIEPSTMVGWALDEFMQRHRDEFLPVESEN